VRECTDPRTMRARIGWWWRVDQYRPYPYGWGDRTGWRPTQAWAQRVADRLVRRDDRRVAKGSW
jgi:hypothetical protein